MSLLDPIVPYLGPLGPALAVSGTLVVILGLIGIVSFMLYKVKRDIFETSIGWVGATVVLSLITILFRGMTYLCGCAWYYDTGGNPTALVPLSYTRETITQGSDASSNRARKARRESREAQSYRPKNLAFPTSHTDSSDEE